MPTSTPPRLLALNSSPSKLANLHPADLVAKLAGVKALRCGRGTLGDLCSYITSEREMIRWRLFHTAIADGNFYPTAKWLQDDQDEESSWPVVFGFVVSRPLAEWFRDQPLYVVMRQLEAGLAALYHSDPDRQQAMRCQLYGPVLDRVLEAHQRYFVQGGLDLENEFKTRSQLRVEFDQFVKSHAGAAPPPAFPLLFGLPLLFLREDGERASYDEAREEEHRWFFDLNTFSLGYWGAYVRGDDWERIVEDNGYDELQRSEGSEYLYQAWEDFYEGNKLRYPAKQAHWRDVPPDTYLSS
ncbi:MAG: hypothetical protein V4773_16490 [Verrucomicrobiota bacterium]